MGILIKGEKSCYMHLDDSFFESIKNTNDPDDLRKYTLYFHDILEYCLPESKDSNGLLDNIRLTKGLLVEELDETNDPDQLRKMMRMVYRVLEDNLAVKDETEIKSKLFRRIYHHDGLNNQHRVSI